MCFELENEIGYIDTEQEYSSAVRDDQKAPLSPFVESRDRPIALCGREVPYDRGINALRGMIRSWNHQGCSLD